MKRNWTGVIALEGVPTVDDRQLRPGGIDWKSRLPRPLMGATHSDLEQYGWRPVGSVHSVIVDEGVVTAHGYVVIDDIPAGEHMVAITLGSTEVYGRVMSGQFLSLHLVAEGTEPAWPSTRITIDENGSDE